MRVTTKFSTLVANLSLNILKLHRSGFVNIIGRPNVGKSTLMNILLGERLSIITNKPQTTRHRIIGIVNGADYQIVFSDTPGMIKKPAYKMQVAMNRFANSTFEDADVMLFVLDVQEEYDDEDALLAKLKAVEAPLFLVLNKIDTIDELSLGNLIQAWSQKVNFTEIIPIAALHRTNTGKLLELIVKYLPEGPEYYPKDQLTDRTERFFVSEIIREKILLNYHQEIPYSVEVVVESFKEGKTTKGEDLVRIYATVFVERENQKFILIGNKGSAIKKLGTDARTAIETFLEKKVFLELHVKIKENWRDDDNVLKNLGY